MAGVLSRKSQITSISAKQANAGLTAPTQASAASQTFAFRFARWQRSICPGAVLKFLARARHYLRTAPCAGATAGI